MTDTKDGVEKDLFKDDIEMYENIEGNNKKRKVGSTGTAFFSPWLDRVQDMAPRRRLAQKLSSKYSWYFPGKTARRQYEQALKSNPNHGDDQQPEVIPPSLDNAWAYFEHFVLPRYYVDDNRKKLGAVGKLLSGSIVSRSVDVLRRSEPGEFGRSTKLYPVWETSEDDLGDFGIGVGLYFYTLKAIAFILFICGCINIVNMLNFSSDDYVSDHQDSIYKRILKGSAICTDVTWEACPSCLKSDWDDESDRYAESLSDPQLKFIRVNRCTIDQTFGIVNIVTLCFVLLAMITLGFILRRKSVEFDESMQTASDYSIVVKNPPSDARDVDEWKNFFESIREDIHVSLCTISLNNEELLRPLIQRRKLLLQIENRLPAGINFDPKRLHELVPLCMSPSWIQRYLCFAQSTEVIYDNIKEIDDKVAQLSKKEYDCTTVYITFETEQAQRYILETLTTSIHNANRQSIPTDFPVECLFRDKHLLRVKEPDEPNSIRWMDLNVSDLNCFIQRAMTFFLSICLLVGCAFLIYLARKRNAFTASIIITILNRLTPMVVKFLNSFEAHRNQSSYQASQFIKITLFRWVNTAVITLVITPFTDTLQNGSFLINSIFTICITEMTVNPVLQMLNYMSNFQMHVLGPRAVDQRRMNLHFQGGYYEIGERYTAMTKVLFFTLFYCTLFPLGFFFATVTLVITYWTDKYSLLRTWMAAPQIGPEISDFTRKIFLPLAVLAYAIVGSYQYASFPFDNACSTNENMMSEYVNRHSVKDLSGALFTVDNIAEDSSIYKYCSQDMMRFSPPAFPAVPKFQEDGSKWMNDTQEGFSAVYGWFSFAALFAIGFSIISSNLFAFRSYFFKVYKPRGNATDLQFSKEEGINGYIPQIKLPGYAFPLLTTNTDHLIPDMIGWADPNKSYDHHNMVFDVPKIAKEIAKKRSEDDEAKGEQKHEQLLSVGLFSIVRYWAPSEIEK